MGKLTTLDNYVLRSRLGTVTPKYFPIMLSQHAEGMIPTGLVLKDSRYQRVPLHLLFPEIEGISLWTYWHLRIACCGRMIVKYGDTLQDCDVCVLNHGYVCPSCLGAGLLSSNDRCPVCRYDRTDEKGKLVSVYDNDKELLACQRWLSSRFPYGVPKEPTDDDLRRMDAYVL
jgi:hypothetical protein